MSIFGSREYFGLQILTAKAQLVQKFFLTEFLIRYCVYGVQGADRLVLYISWKLSEKESRYSTIVKKCLAIRWADGALRYYLLGWPFVLCLDRASPSGCTG